MKPWRLLFCFVVGCGGGDAVRDFTSIDAGGESDASATTPDATTTSDAMSAADATTTSDATTSDVATRDALGEPSSMQPDVGAAIDANPVDASARDASARDAVEEEPPCELWRCGCGGPYVALCCEGPCPSGWEGYGCYCGDCRFPNHVNDAGHCAP